MVTLSGTSVSWERACAARTLGALRHAIDSKRLRKRSFNTYEGKPTVAENGEIYCVMDMSRDRRGGTLLLRAAGGKDHVSVLRLIRDAGLTGAPAWVVADQDQGIGKAVALAFPGMDRLACPTNSVAAVHQDVAKERHPSKNENTPDDYIKGSTEMAWWMCSKSRHGWQARIERRTLAGQGYPKRAREAAKQRERDQTARRQRRNRQFAQVAKALPSLFDNDGLPL
jgi:hypothetical protein